MIKQQDSLEFLKEQKDFSIDISYSDPPYNLGSEIIVRPDGKMDYKRKSEFMNQWEAMGGDWWERWFKESYRSLKYGGYCIMFSIDRQCSLFKYYAIMAGFSERQSCYWYSISSFPKSSDLSKNLDKNAGAKREVIKESPNARPQSLKEDNLYKAGTVGKDFNITAPLTPLAKKYNGYKYSICPLKSTNETILIFQTEYKTGSCMKDVLAYENGDKKCGCFALDIDGGRVPTSEEDKKIKAFGSMPESKVGNGGFLRPWMKNKQSILDKQNLAIKNMQEMSRYPSQTFIECICDEVITEPTETKEPEEVSGGIWKKSTGKPAGRTYKGGRQIHTNPDCPCSILDRQSGVKTSKQTVSARAGKHNTGIYGDFKGQENIKIGYNESSGCSKILHKCSFEKGEHDLYFYNPKVNKSERNLGCENLDEKDRFQQGNYSQSPICSVCNKTFNGTNDHSKCGKDTMVYKTKEENKKTVNTMPCLKPIALNKKILKLFKTPNPQNICYPFAGSFSEVIGGYKAGFTDFTGCEISEEYIKIGEARFKHWTRQKTLF